MPRKRKRMECVALAGLQNTTRGDGGPGHRNARTRERRGGTCVIVERGVRRDQAGLRTRRRNKGPTQLQRAAARDKKTWSARERKQRWNEYATQAQRGHVRGEAVGGVAMACDDRALTAQRRRHVLRAVAGRRVPGERNCSSARACKSSGERASMTAIQDRDDSDGRVSEAERKKKRVKSKPHGRRLIPKPPPSWEGGERDMAQHEALKRKTQSEECRAGSSRCTPGPSSPAGRMREGEGRERGARGGRRARRGLSRDARDLEGRGEGRRWDSEERGRHEQCQGRVWRDGPAQPGEHILRLDARSEHRGLPAFDAGHRAVGVVGYVGGDEGRRGGRRRGERSTDVFQYLNLTERKTHSSGPLGFGRAVEIMPVDGVD
ncbi:hypothetical protein FB451DRAFT_1183992 [Mycena latifolia]|nr:hypothetical protein FB451DRAFT_1183992 [Mycena latifolia]